LVGEAKSTDALIIGGGLIGLATAFQLLKTLPHLKITVLEKEGRLGAESERASSRVLQSGLWCGPGLLNPAFCREGRLALERFCEDEGVPWKRCGKLIVANGEEEDWLRQLRHRADAGGIAAEWWGSIGFGEQVPYVAGIAGIFLSEAGIVDYEAVCDRLARRIRDMGGEFHGNAEVNLLAQTSGSVQVETANAHFEAKVLFNCAGLQADELARRAGASPGVWLVPFRAAYQELDAEGRKWVDRLIYRVPSPVSAFGAVRLIPSTDGRVECGPQVAPAISRENRASWLRAWSDLSGQLNYPGFVPMIKRDWRSAVREGWRRCRGGGVVDEVSAVS